MSMENMAFLAFVIGALGTFGGVLAWASWMEGRENRRKTQAPAPAPQRDKVVPLDARQAG